MSAVYPSLPKLTMRDGYDDDDLTDIDDEVFIRDGKSGSLKLDEDSGVKRPLMAPRRKPKKPGPFSRHKFPSRAIVLPVCCGMTALMVFSVLIIFCIFAANVLPMPLTVLRHWLSHKAKEPQNDTCTVPCTSLSTKLLWSRTLPSLNPTSPLRSTDANDDGVEDIVFGFSTGINAANPPEYTCTLDSEGQVPCLGGVIAINGRNSETLWMHPTVQAITSIDCGLDLTSDNIKDCVISNDHGILHAISGSNGNSIWEIPVQHLSPSDERRILDLYGAKFVADMDGDGIGDVIASHAVQTLSLHSSEILMISGATGTVIRTAKLPESEQLILGQVQTLVHPDGENIFVLATNSQKQSGGLYVVPQVNLMYGDLKLRKLQHSTGKGGPIVPPILVDITSDGIEDIIAAMFNSSIVAYDGFTFKPLWNYTVPDSEVISVPIPGYYNDDDVPDFMVKHQIGAGFPTYYYTIATVIDGKTGQPLLEKPMEDSLSGEMAGLSVSVDDFGNDWFLHWSMDCRNFEGVKEKYQFLQGEILASQVQADLCGLRFNSTLVSNLYALSQHVGPPGISLYFSEDWQAVEYNNSADLKIDSSGEPFVSVRSPKGQSNQAKDKFFKSEDDDVPPVADRFISEGNYDKYVEYKDQKRPSLTDFEGGSSPIVSDTFNEEYAWKRGENKWQRDKIADKDYAIYDNENTAGALDDRSVDYPAVEEVREQRSDFGDRANRVDRVSDSLTLAALNNSEYRVALDSNNSIRRKRDTNFTSKSYNDTNNTTDNLYQNDMFNETTGTNQNSTQPPEDSSSIKVIYNISTSTPEYNSTSDTPRENSTGSSNIDELDSMIKSADKYVHIFPSPIENTDDENIEKIFKRESLKNQNKRSNSGKQSKNHRQKRQAKQSGKKSTIDGIQQQSPTGILLPSFAESKDRKSIDLVFATSWLTPSDVSVVLLPEDLECVHRKKALSPRKFQYRDAEVIEKECLTERGVNYKVYQESMDRENYKAPVGQMTLYRMKLECACPEDMLPNQSCKNISTHQSWSQYLGPSGNGYFRPLRKPKV